MKKHLVFFSAVFLVLSSIVMSCDDSTGSPEISLAIGDNLESGGNYSFDSVSMLSKKEVVGTIKNEGTSTLTVDSVIISGNNSDQFTITAFPNSVIEAGESSSFTIAFEGTSAGAMAAVLTVNNNDDDESSFTVNLNGNSSDRSWTEATPAANWAARYSHAGVMFKDKMWIMGGIDKTGGIGNMNDVWYSSDGETWTQATSAAAWEERQFPRALVYDDKIWVIGGYGDGGSLNDVWYSSDGTNWTEATSNAAWSKRKGQSVLVYDNKMWVMGGYDDTGYLNDVWYSTDGANWTEAQASAAWDKRSDMGALSFNGMMWIMGGENVNSDDVWYSTDGVNWTKSTNTGDSWDLYQMGAVVYDGKMWIMGGRTGFVTKNDFYCSKDGAKWLKIDCSTIWGVRSKLQAIVYKDRIWVTGGNQPGSPDIPKNDVWWF